MATAKQLAWRREFARRYGKKKKSTSSRKKKARPTKKGGSTVPRRSYKTRKYARKKTNSITIPTVDILHGYLTVDTAADGAVTKNISRLGKYASGRYSWKGTWGGIKSDWGTSAEDFSKAPAERIIKSGAVAGGIAVARRLAGYLPFVPKSVTILKLGKTSIKWQVR